MALAARQELAEGVRWEMAAEVRELKEKETTLLARLRRGEEKIAAARASGANVERWEDMWIGLLHEYEQVYDRLAVLMAVAS